MTAQQEIAPEAKKAFHSHLLMCLNTESDPGGEVNFHTQNERMPVQKEHGFRLRHQ
jgi:hypothetical protein